MGTGYGYPCMVRYKQLGQFHMNRIAGPFSRDRLCGFLHGCGELLKNFSLRVCDGTLTGTKRMQRHGTAKTLLLSVHKKSRRDAIPFGFFVSRAVL